MRSATFLHALSKTSSHEKRMPELSRRSAIAAAVLTAAATTELAHAAAADEQPLTKDQEFIIAAGLTKEEADCWLKIAEAAGAFFKLPELHPMDQQEVASAIHIVQNKLLGRPTYRKYLELAKQSRAKDGEK